MVGFTRGTTAGELFDHLDEMIEKEGADVVCHVEPDGRVIVLAKGKAGESLLAFLKAAIPEVLEREVP